MWYFCVKCRGGTWNARIPPINMLPTFDSTKPFKIILRHTLACNRLLTTLQTVMALHLADTQPSHLMFLKINRTIKNDPHITIHQMDAITISCRMTLITNWCMNTLKEQGLASFCILLHIPPSINNYNSKTVNQWMMAIRSSTSFALRLPTTEVSTIATSNHHTHNDTLQSLTNHWWHTFW